VAKPTFTDYKLLMKSLKEVKRIIKVGTDEDVKDYIQSIVPNYKRQGDVNYNMATNEEETGITYLKGVDLGATIPGDGKD